MFQLTLAEILVADREREIQNSLRRRRLMKPDDGATDPATLVRPVVDPRALSIRVRPSGG